jgi:DNA (cytosine-5)-methyltransferase 1
MTRPLLLDLFCGAGGAAMGYHRAGFDVVGVDIKPQPHFPFEFHQADAMEYDWTGYDVIHASPPCQAYSTTRTLHANEYPELVGLVQMRLGFLGADYVIENVVGAPLVNPVKLCGSSFDLGVRRHRLFESNVPFMAPSCAHEWQPHPIDVTGGGPSTKPRTDGKGGRSRKPRDLKQAGEVMGIDWMSRDELNEAIPPAYTEFVGSQLIEHLSVSTSPNPKERG